jgi:hypothetical protein
MASLIFAHSKSIVGRAKKAASKAGEMAESMGADVGQARKAAYELELRNEMAAFDEYLRVSSVLHERYMDTMKPTHQSYFITIRPDDTKCNLLEFKEKVLSFVSRKCFLSYKLSFEQKGTCPTELGIGFHVHIVAELRQRSKAEVLRDTMSSWNDWVSKGWIAANCIQILTTRNPEKIVSDYLIEYKSDDGHKEVTKGMDALWRSSNDLKDLYESH